MERLREHVQQVTWPNGHRIILLAEGRQLNHTCSCVPSLVVSVTHATQVQQCMCMWGTLRVRTHVQTHTCTHTLTHREGKMVGERLFVLSYNYHLFTCLRTNTVHSLIPFVVYNFIAAIQ